LRLRNKIVDEKKFLDLGDLMREDFDYGREVLKTPYEGTMELPYKRYPLYDVSLISTTLGLGD
jgi:hypothetical protein